MREDSVGAFTGPPGKAPPRLIMRTLHQPWRCLLRSHLLLLLFVVICPLPLTRGGGASSNNCFWYHSCTSGRVAKQPYPSAFVVAGQPATAAFLQQRQRLNSGLLYTRGYVGGSSSTCIPERRNRSSASSFSMRLTSRPRAPAQHQRYTARRSALKLASSTDNNNDEQSVDQQSQRLLHDFKSDLNSLEQIRPNVPSADVSAPFTLISAGSSYTRLWTTETWKSHSKPPHLRYLRHVLRWPWSTTARVVMPTVVAATMWGATLSLASKHLPQVSRFVGKATCSTTALSMLSAPLALLLTLRANASMSRLVEARLLWGRLILHVRSLASMVRIYLYPQCPVESVFIARHLACLGWILKSAMRGESIQQEQEVLRTMLGHAHSDSCNWLNQQPKRTVGICSRIRQAVSKAMTKLASAPGTSSVSSSIHLLLEQRIGELESCVGGCERLLTSPIPPTYSRHLSRVMFIWIILMPGSLVSLGLSTCGVVTATALGTYVLVGLDEVGMEIENAFQLLPLQQLAAAAQNGVKSQFLNDLPAII